ncbi:MAG: rRNA maturation RNase YbeY [Rhizobiaceae bacterium]
MEIDIAVNCPGWPDPAHLEDLTGKAVSAAIRAARLKMPRHCELSMVFCSDAEIRDVNKQWRGQDKATNVLSFPAQDIKPGGKAGAMLGDIVLALETIQAESALEGKPFDHHLTHLVVHGFLHLFGYDHMDEQEALVMEGHESAAMMLLGLDDPYAE